MKPFVAAAVLLLALAAVPGFDAAGLRRSTPPASRADCYARPESLRGVPCFINTPRIFQTGNTTAAVEIDHHVDVLNAYNVVTYRLTFEAVALRNLRAAEKAAEGTGGCDDGRENPVVAHFRQDYEDTVGFEGGLGEGVVPVSVGRTFSSPVGFELTNGVTYFVRVAGAVGFGSRRFYIDHPETLIEMRPMQYQ